MRGPEFSRCILISLVVFLVFLAAPCASAQIQGVDALAAQVAAAIVRSKKDAVVVLDFNSADTRLNPVGVALADDFSVALARTGTKLHVDDRSRAEKLMQDNWIETRNVSDPGIGTWLAHRLGDNAVILGTMTPDAGAIDLSVASYVVSSGKDIAVLPIKIPLTDELKRLISDKPDPIPNKLCISDSSAPCAGKNGYSMPRCIYCPKAEYPDEVAERQIQGNVLLVVIVDTNGRPKDIHVARALPYGLTLQAVRAVQKWKFDPATGPDGKPANVRTPIEVAFHLYSRN